MQELLRDFGLTIDQAYQRMLSMRESDVSLSPSFGSSSPGQWSRKQILGHLIDSANNNHRRFVLAQIHNEVIDPGYDQEGWVSVQGYKDEQWATLAELWKSYNLHLLHVMSRAPQVKLSTRCVMHDGESVSLGFLMEDYVRHMKHHLDQILG